MLGMGGLRSLLGLERNAGSPVVLLYTEKNSERLTYVCGFIFEHVLKTNFVVTHNAEQFETSQDFKINYSSKTLSGGLQIVPQNLLFQKGISEEKPPLVKKNKLLYFYENSRGFHFDIFAAVFYCIARYEEWQLFKPDTHGRFEASESVFFQHSLHLKPLVDIWINELRRELEGLFPSKTFPAPRFKVISTIDVDNVYAYREKGLVRTLGATVRDLLKWEWGTIKERYLVLRGKRRDPFDIYEEVSEFCFDNKIPLLYFFLFRTGTTFDRTLNPHSPAFFEVFNKLRENKALIGIHPSYEAGQNEALLEEEIQQLNSALKEQVQFSRQHYLRLDIRWGPKMLLKNGISCDFTMGFASTPGFRAGTSYPFYYFDFEQEKSTELLMLPFCAMDGAYTVYAREEAGQALNSLMDLASEIKKAGGFFITVFHERSFSDHLYKGFGTLYKKLHMSIKD